MGTLSPSPQPRRPLPHLQARFEQGHIYTQMGGLELLALNPYADVARYEQPVCM